MAKRFDFFHLKKIDGFGSGANNKLDGLEPSSFASSPNRLYIGDNKGWVHHINRSFEVQSFIVHGSGSVHHMCHLKRGLLLTVSRDSSSSSGATAVDVVKVWNTTSIETAGDLAPIHVLPRLPPGSGVITAMAAHDNLSCLAVGDSLGNVYLYRGDISRPGIVSRNFRKLPTTTHDGKVSPVTALAFRASGVSMHLFVALERQISCFDLSKKLQESFIVLDPMDGCSEGCGVLSEGSANQEPLFVVGRRDGFHFFLPDAAGGSFGSEGDKMSVSWLKGYLVTLAKPNQQLQPRLFPANSGSASGNSHEPHEPTIVTVHSAYMDSKYVAFNKNIPGALAVVAADQWNGLFVVTKSCELFQLTEIDTEAKLEQFFKKNAYSLAVSLAKAHDYDEEGLTDIFRLYGDYLYSTGQFGAAMEQYIKTIGRLESSYVIQKYLEEQLIKNLTQYLEALHKAPKVKDKMGNVNATSRPSEDHTTLLLNCYTKLQDRDKLKDFILSSRISSRSGSNERDFVFDVDVAVKVCRTAGYFDEALSLAESYARHDIFLKITIDDLSDFKGALEYIKQLKDDACKRRMLVSYGKGLIKAIPSETTELLIQLCTPGTGPSRGEEAETSRSQFDSFLHIFSQDTPSLLEFLEHVTTTVPDLCSVDVWNLLFEIYLQRAISLAETDKAGCEKLRKSALSLLSNPKAKYDWNKVLMVCQLYDFQAGCAALYESKGMYYEVLKLQMKQPSCKQTFEEIFETCSIHSGATISPQTKVLLWNTALDYYVERLAVAGDEGAEASLLKGFIDKTIDVMEKERMSTPLQMVELLSRKSKGTRVGTIRKFLRTRLLEDNTQVSENEALVEKYRTATAALRSKVANLSKEVKIFQESRCGICNKSLQLPTVHFLCGHSFHQICLEDEFIPTATAVGGIGGGGVSRFSGAGGSVFECPSCMSENREIEDRIACQARTSRSLTSSPAVIGAAATADPFFKDVETADNKFAVVAKGVGQGLLSGGGGTVVK